MRQLGPTGRDDPAESPGPAQGDIKFPGIDPGQDGIDERGQFCGTRRLGGAGDDVTGLGQAHPRGILPACGLRGAQHPLTQGIQPPQGAGQRPCGASRPQGGDGVEPEFVDEGDEPRGDLRVPRRPADADDGLGGGVRDLGLLRGSGSARAEGFHRCQAEVRRAAGPVPAG